MDGNSPPRNECSVGGDIDLSSLRGRSNRIVKQNREETEDSNSFPVPKPETHSKRSIRHGIFWLFNCKFTTYVYLILTLALIYTVTFMMWENSVLLGLKKWKVRDRRFSEFPVATTLKFVPRRFPRDPEERREFELRLSDFQIGVRPPKLVLILGNMDKDAQSLMLLTVVKNLQKVGYVFEIFALDIGTVRPAWERLCGQIFLFKQEHYGHVDWSSYEGVMVYSLEAKEAIRSLMQEPFCSIPLMWIIQEHTLADRLPTYKKKIRKHLLSHWKNTFRRVNAVVFPNFALPLQYSLLDSGNFLVIPQSPVDVLAANRYNRTHSKFQLREHNGFSRNDLLVLVVGSFLYYDKLPSLHNALEMSIIEPLLKKYARNKAKGSFKFLFLCGTSAEKYDDALQKMASKLGLLHDSIRRYGFDGDMDSFLLMADIVLYGSSKDIQEFPPLLVRAMAYEIPILTPDFPVVQKYIVNRVHGAIFQKENSRAFLDTFSHLISEGKLSEFAQRMAYYGRKHAKNMFALECINNYAKLLENVLNFPSHAILPRHVSEFEQVEWEWNFFRNDFLIRHQKQANYPVMDSKLRAGSVVFALEEEFTNHVNSGTGNRTLLEEIPNQEDWHNLREIESDEKLEMLEREELDDRNDKYMGIWDKIYKNAKNSHKLRFETNERDEGELERIGQPLCIYEIYNGAATLPFLNHGTLYRGLSLSPRTMRSTSDDINAVKQLPLLNETFYRNSLCEIGAIFAVANKIDNIHKSPWIGFQSWHATGRKVSLSRKAETNLRVSIEKHTRGDVIYFWTRMDVDIGTAGNNNDFWAICDFLNWGCRTIFEDAFRQMYDLSPDIEALPPMPYDGGFWSGLHSWVMPTPSFLEFIIFSRIFVDSLDALHCDFGTSTNCLLGFSKIEKRHCYCKIMEILVNVWAYHSGRRMIRISPLSGGLEENHPVEERRNFMWAKYFNSTLLKKMDEELAEAADDGDYPRKNWLWPLTGEVHCEAVDLRNKDEKNKAKLEKQKRMKEKKQKRTRLEHKQKPIGR